MFRPREAILMDSFSVEPFGGDVLQIADINNDNEYEMLILQTAGQFCSEVYRDRDDLDEIDRTLYCLTAIDSNGKIIWQDGKPYDRDFPFTAHGGQSEDMMLKVEDVDLDGKAEIIVIRHGELAILEADSGKTRNSIELPSDNHVKVYTAQLGPPEEGRQIICKVNDKAYKPWEYANPVVIYNADLSVYHEPFSVKGAGHNLVAMDINDDGRDELFIGYSLLDNQCKEIWTIDLGKDFNYTKEHADQIAVSDINEDDKPEIRYAGSEDFFVADIDGNILWKAKAGHSQTSAEGLWGFSGERRIVMSEKNKGLWGMDTGGRIIWHRTDINGYATDSVKWARKGIRKYCCLFRPQLKPITPTPYESDPSWSADIWPRFLDGDGALYDVLPWKDEYAQPSQLIRASRSYDCGVKYYPIAMDIDKDELDEVIVYDRRQVWIFHSPE